MKTAYKLDTNANNDFVIFKASIRNKHEVFDNNTVWNEKHCCNNFEKALKKLNNCYLLSSKDMVPMFFIGPETR